MEKLVIAVGQSRTAKYWKNTEITWEEFTNRLRMTTRTAETQGEYKNMTKKQQDNVKDVGGFVGGRLQGGRRKADCVINRTLLTLDADFASEDFIDCMELFAGYAWCIYSTHKHMPEKPRLRLVIPLNRPCLPDEYEAIARRIAANIGINMFDDTTYQSHRLMYWPSTSIDGEYLFRTGEGKFLDVDSILNSYDDWTDVSSWSVSSRTVKHTERLIKKQEDPTEKSGIIGAFCRTYTVEQAIEKFLPKVYTACAVENRYTYTQGSTAAGLVVYENGKFAYSNHATDPISGMLCNAFDLVRIHKFAEKDEEAAENTPAAKLPSFLAMQELAAKDTEVKKLLHKERMTEAEKDFSSLIEEEDSSWIETLEMDKKGRVIPTIDNAIKILVHDQRLKEKAALNEFTGRHRIMGIVPWDAREEERDWTDTDDAGLRHYLEKTYELKGKDKISDAWLLASDKNRFHPVREYLDSLIWDGTKRVERLLIDYLGAEDNIYTKMVTKKSLTACVARIYEPGIKFDTVLVLVGPQGCGKSQIIKLLGKDWFSDTLTTVQGKEAYEQVQGFWIIEIAELAAMKKIEIEAIKHFIAKSEDAFRASYGRHVKTNKRQCVFFGTTNTREFLRDMTGNRRFWPVDVMIQKPTRDLWRDLDSDEIDQIWAEAITYYKEGYPIHIDDDSMKAVVEEEQEKHFEENPMTGSILQYLDTLLPEPEEWEKMDLSDRRFFIQGDDFGNTVKGTVKRQRVCALEVWCEMFNGDKRDLTIQKSKEIKAIIMKTGQWEPMKTNARFGNIYGSQRGFYRL